MPHLKLKLTAIAFKASHHQSYILISDLTFRAFSVPVMSVIACLFAPLSSIFASTFLCSFITMKVLMTSCQNSSLSLVLWKINEWELRSVAKEERTVTQLPTPLNVLSEYYISNCKLLEVLAFFFFFFSSSLLVTA